MDLNQTRADLEEALLESAHENMGPGVAKLYALAYGIHADLKAGRLIEAPQPGPTPEEAPAFDDDPGDPGDVVCVACHDAAPHYCDRRGGVVGWCGDAVCRPAYDRARGITI